jgi:elongation factor 1-beta
MGSYVIRMKLLPQDATADTQRIVDSVARSLPADAKLRGHRVEPIAFGLSAILIDVVAPEEEGSIERVEASVSRAPMVGQYEILGVSRMSSRLPPS